MFGIYRFLLALVVAAAHLKGVSLIGAFAVSGFYTLSGYLMCRILCERYGFGLTGLRAYGINRFLRIFPTYWVACAMTLGLMAWLGTEAASHFWRPWAWPVGAREWIDQITLVNLSFEPMNRLVPPSWALRVELFYYAAIALGLGRWRGVVGIWLIASVGYHVYLAQIGAPPAARYYPISAAALPFALGAFVYHFRDWFPLKPEQRLPSLATLAAAWLFNIYSMFFLGQPMGHFYVNFYANMLISVLALLVLQGTESGSRRLKWWDGELGSLSYPIYLIHFQIGLAVAVLLGVPKNSQQLVMTSLVPLLVASWVIARLVDSPVERLRGVVKRRLTSA